MRLSSFSGALASDLATLGRLGDEATRSVTERLAEAIPALVTARLVQLLGDLAAELDASLPSGRAEVRLSGDDAAIVIASDETGSEPDDPAQDRGPDAADSGEARVTLRLPAPLKVRLEQQAAAQGLSLNSHLVRLLNGTATAPPAGPHIRPAGRRLTGYGRA